MLSQPNVFVSMSVYMCSTTYEEAENKTLLFYFGTKLRFVVEEDSTSSLVLVSDPVIIKSSSNLFTLYYEYNNGY